MVPITNYWKDVRNILCTSLDFIKLLRCVTRLRMDYILSI